GKIPFTSTFANFISQRSCDQSFMAAYNNFNVKLVGIYAGLSSAINGGTHMSVEDIAIYRSMPNTIVISPGDSNEFSKALETAAETYGPVYISIARGPMVTLLPEDYKFKISKSVVMEEGSDITLITTGITTYEGVQACRILKQKGISVRHIHMPVIKPIDKEEIIKSARETGIIVTVENHSRFGGLGSTVAETVCRECPVKVEILGLDDMFGETGKLEWLMDRFKISSKHICDTIIRLLKNDSNTSIKM
ncbi:MAG: transketolase C-terminal domain-containing protein, partial [Clostridiales bacterium]|nr:transketolase C-terminal domain-containing protein [Clostridiales bacterium]